MKKFSTTLVRIPKYLSSVFILMLFSISGNIGMAQGIGCKALQFYTIPQAGNCCYKLMANNSTPDNCFQQVNLNLGSDLFVNFTGLSGWRTNKVSDSEYNIRPAVGFIPMGLTEIASFCIEGGPASQIIFQWDNLCLMESCDSIMNIPGCIPKGNIDGFVYVDIGCQGKPYSKQPGLADWTIEVYDVNFDLILTTQTDSTGYYSFFDLPIGNYTVVLCCPRKPWTPVFPLLGRHSIIVEKDQTKRANFGMCANCPCDSLNYYIQLTEEKSDTINYYISLKEFYEPCWNRYSLLELKVDSGLLVEFQPINNDICCTETNKVCCHWTAQLGANAQTVLLSHVSGFLPKADQFILKVSVAGGMKHKIVLRLLQSKNDTIGDCRKPFTYNFPIYPINNCCESGHFKSQELICNGDFNITSPVPGICFKSDYNYFTGPAIGPGNFTIGNSNVVSSINAGSWICMGLNGPNDNVLIVDGSKTNLRIWEQTVSVVRNRKYQFGIYMNCILTFNTTSPQIDIFFNNTLVNTLTAPFNSGWNKLDFCWNSGDTTQLTITIRTKHNDGYNDFALDGISLKSCIPDSLCCDPSNFSALHYDLNGVPIKSLVCGDTLKADCKSQNILTVNGNFICASSNCKPQSMSATLIKPDGSSIAVPLNWTNPVFQLSIPPTDLVQSGFYYLSIQAICGSSICTCDFVICVECCLETFENDPVGTKSQWLELNSFVWVTATAPGNTTHVLRGDDGEGKSWMYNKSEYVGNWINQYKGCLCFDIRYDPNTNSNPPKGNHTLYLFNGNTPIASTLRAVFVSKTQIGNSWERICAPIALAGNSLPSNSYGQWKMSAGSNSSFNSLITNVNGIGFAIDFASGQAAEEILYVDNICVEKCLDSCYCGPHKILYSIGRGPLLEKKCGDTLDVPASGSILPINFLYQFSCIGERCDTPSVEWTLTGPGNFIPKTGAIGSATNPTANREIVNSTFVLKGLYTLTINGMCGNNICPCTIYFNAEGFECCQDSIASQSLAANLVNTQVDGATCKVTLNIQNVPDCMQITNINWGDGKIDNNIYTTGGMAMHIYSSSGNYSVSWTVIEYDKTGKICRTFRYQNLMNINCECECKGLGWAEYFYTDPQPIPVRCNNTSPIVVACKKFGPSFFLHGDLSCIKSTCNSDSVHWKLYKDGIPNPVVQNIDINPYPHFDILIPWSYFNQGKYTLKVFRYCNGMQCECSFNIVVDACPCSCDFFSQNIALGFDVSSLKNDCKKTFKPLDLCDQDEVLWIINSQSVTGTSIGNAEFSHTFTNNGNYKVCMVVSRTDAFGIICRDTFCRNIFINCNINDGYFCSPDKIQNGNFERIVLGSEVLEIGHKKDGIQNWELFNNPGSLGLVIAYNEPGGFDLGSLTMIGNQNNFAGIVQIAPIIEANLQAQRYKMHLGYNFINYLDNDPNEPELEFRLQKNNDRKDAQDKILLTKRKDMREDIEDKRKTWMVVDTTILVENLEPGIRYFLVVCLRNKSGTEYSFIGIDNINVCLDEIEAIDHTGNVAFDATICPNPSSNDINIIINTPTVKIKEIEILDLNGIKVNKTIIKTDSNIISMDISSLEQGIYFVHFYGTKGRLKSMKFVRN